MTEGQYKALPGLVPNLGSNGLNSSEMLDLFKDNDSVSFPTVYYCPYADSTFKILDIPMTDTLIAGEAYEFSFKDYNIMTFPTLFFKRKQVDRAHWNVNDSIYYIKYRPKESGVLRIYVTKRISKIKKIKKRNMYYSKRIYYTFLEYVVKKKSEEK